ncbi:MAG: FapA family protein [Armatimonadetes bacterium]|nr:FapA family protein [Armatimonadota bacterium]
MEDIDGRFDVRFNSNRTQASVILSPAQGNGKEVTPSQIVDRLLQMRIGSSVREKAIHEGIRQARLLAVSIEIVVAQGIVPKDGQDAKIHYKLSESLLRHHPPKHPDLPDAINWFGINPLQLVKKGQELATITALQIGSVGKTCTLPPQDVPYMPGKPAEGAMGAHITLNANGLRAHASENGYFYLHGERLTIIPLHVCYTEIKDGEYTFGKGALLYEGASNAQITAGDFIAIRKTTKNSTLRVHGDVLLQNAEGCTIIASGNVFVEGCLLNCDVRTPRKVLCGSKARVSGGAIRAHQGLVAGVIGTPDSSETLIEVGNDYYTPLRKMELERDLVTCQYNLRRVQATLKPFEDSPAHKTLKNYRDMVEKCQYLQHAELERIRSLKTEQHRLVAFTKECTAATVEVGTIYPGVQIRNGRLQLKVESVLHSVQFVEALRKTAIQAVPLAKAS